MKLTAFLQIYNELEKGNLPRYMDSIARYCDAIVVYDDGSTDGSMDYILDCIDQYVGWESSDLSYQPKLKEIRFIENKTNDFQNELAHKQCLLEEARKLNSDWIIWLDADEVIEPEGEQFIRQLCKEGEFDSYNFFNRNLWRSEKYFRIDELWAQGLFCRLWRVTDDLYFDVKSGLHHSLVPKNIGSMTDIKDTFVLHYGFASDQAIIDKYNMYKAHGQSGRALDRLIDESTLKLAPSPTSWFRHEPTGPEAPGIFAFDIRSKL